MQFFNKLHLQYLLRVKKDHTYFRGSGQLPVHIDGIQPEAGKGISILDYNYQPASLETLNAVKMPAYLKHFRENDYLQFVSHPKMLSNHNIDSTARFIRNVLKKYEVEFDFTKFISSSVLQY